MVYWSVGDHAVAFVGMCVCGGRIIGLRDRFLHLPETTNGGVRESHFGVSSTAREVGCALAYVAAAGANHLMAESSGLPSLVGFPPRKLALHIVVSVQLVGPGLAGNPGGSH